MKKRKLAKMAVIVAIIIFAIYKFVTPPITYKIDSRLIEINDTLKALSEEYEFDFLSVYPYRANPQEFSDIVPDKVYRKARKLNIHVVHFYNGPDRQSAAFRVDRLLFSLSPVWYYRYSDDGLTEEEVVPSIEEAVKHNDMRFYAYCQKAEVTNWFFCTQARSG